MNSDYASDLLSFIALNRSAEEEAAKDAKYRRDLERCGKPLLSHARALADEALLERLHSVGIELDIGSYAEIAEHALSAEEIFRTAVTAGVRARFKTPFDEDWVWLALTVLWERWFPQWPNFEQFEDQMQAGYALAETDPAGACERWFPAWDAFLLMFDKGNFKFIDEFDGAFRGTQFVSNWVGDFETELGNAGPTDPRWHERRIQFCEAFLRHFPGEDELTIQNMRRALAEAIFGLGACARGDALYEQWLKADPQWGWGWIDWADNYSRFAADANRDSPRAEALLKQGLNVPCVRDREDILERIVELCREQGRLDEAEAFQARSESICAAVTCTSDRGLSLKTKLNFGEEGIPRQLPALAEQKRREHEQLIESVTRVRLPKVGRNDPCPCGSGKKYKKCCLPREEAAARQLPKTARATPTLSQSEGRGELAAPAVSPEPDADFQEDLGAEDSLPPETRRKLDELWEAFQALSKPTVEQMDTFLEGLLDLPPAATRWSDLFRRFARAGHRDLPAVFRRIAGGIAHTAGAGLSFFYWAAAEELACRGHRLWLPEVARGFRKLDLESYDADALKHLEDWLLAEGFENETLALTEHFLPILRADDELLPYAVPQTCNLIFELRAGRHLRGGSGVEADEKRLAKKLRQGLEQEIHADAARNAAEVITGQSPAPTWSRAEFDLVPGDVCSDANAWRECLRLFGALMRVAREAGQFEQRPSGCVLRGLTLMLNSVHDALDHSEKKPRNASRSLLDHLLPAGLEARLVRSCRDVIGVNEPRARLMLDTHGVLLRFATRHQLMSEPDIARSRQNLDRLQRHLDRRIA